MVKHQQASAYIAAVFYSVIIGLSFLFVKSHCKQQSRLIFWRTGSPLRLLRPLYRLIRLGKAFNPRKGRHCHFAARPAVSRAIFQLSGIRPCVLFLI